MPTIAADDVTFYSDAPSLGDALEMARRHSASGETTKVLALWAEIRSRWPSEPRAWS
jgi:hypothetical protein